VLRKIVAAICQAEQAKTQDLSLIEECIYEALLGAGYNSPNPLVCSLVVKDSQIVGKGIHRHFGKEHAERLALQMARERAKGATLYVNLEPCTHVGSQPPCTTAIIEAGIEKVVFGGYDTNPLTSRQGPKVLERANIKVLGPTMPRAEALLNDAYHYCQRFGPPFVCLKLAISLDGKIALNNRDSKWISGKVGRGYAHFLRQCLDAVMVGIGTVVYDNPRLTVRKPILKEFLDEDAERLNLRHPARVVLDPNFLLFEQYDALEQIKLAKKFFLEAEENIVKSLESSGIAPLNIFAKSSPTRDDLPWLIIAGAEDKWSSLRFKSLLPELRGVEVITLKKEDGDVELAELWDKLSKLGIHSVLVEGGAGLAKRILRRLAFTRLDLVVAPIIIGADGLGFSPSVPMEKLEHALKLENTFSFQLGRDTLVRGYRFDFLGKVLGK